MSFAFFPLAEEEQLSQKTEAYADGIMVRHWGSLDSQGLPYQPRQPNER